MRALPRLAGDGDEIATDRRQARIGQALADPLFQKAERNR